MQQVGTPREVYERPANLFVADFMGLVNKLPGTLIERRGGSGRVRIGEQTIDAHLSEGLSGATGPVTVAIRPEAIRLGTGESGAGVQRPERHGWSRARSSATSSITRSTSAARSCACRATGSRAWSPAPRSSLRFPIGECVAMRSDAVEDNQQEQDRS